MPAVVVAGVPVMVAGVVAMVLAGMVVAVVAVVALSVLLVVWGRSVVVAVRQTIFVVFVGSGMLPVLRLLAVRLRFVGGVVFAVGSGMPFAVLRLLVVRLGVIGGVVFAVRSGMLPALRLLARVRGFLPGRRALLAVAVVRVLRACRGRAASWRAAPRRASR